jgi:hypothetical protein
MVVYQEIEQGYQLRSWYMDSGTYITGPRDSLTYNRERLKNEQVDFLDTEYEGGTYWDLLLDYIEITLGSEMTMDELNLIISSVDEDMLFAYDLEDDEETEARMNDKEW